MKLDAKPTLIELVDVWSRMGPDQQELCLILYTTGWAEGHFKMDTPTCLEETIKGYEPFMDKREFDILEIPFKFGGAHIGASEEIPKTHKVRADKKS